MQANPKDDTAILRGSTWFKRVLGHSRAPLEDTQPLAEHHQLIMLIRGITEARAITSSDSLVLGRGIEHDEVDIDLTAYGAQYRGVSRTHARIFLKNDNLYITDLNSTNGTMVSGERLSPYIPCIVTESDEVLLGCLVIQMMVK